MNWAILGWANEHKLSVYAFCEYFCLRSSAHCWALFPNFVLFWALDPKETGLYPKETHLKYDFVMLITSIS